MTPKALSAAMRYLSSLGASKGGRARAANLSPAERSAVARKAAVARWARYREMQREGISRIAFADRDEAQYVADELID